MSDAPTDESVRETALGAISETVRETVRIRLPVPNECDGWRLDRFLKRRIGRLSRTRIQGIIETQISFADGRRVRPATAVHRGDTVILNRPLPPEPEVPRHFDVLAEDEHFMAIDKPAGLPMHTSAKFFRNTLTALLRERYPGQLLDLCHRLDRETSGVLLLARTPRAASHLKRAFARRHISKTYLAIVRGAPTDDCGVIDRPLRILDTKTKILMGHAPTEQGGLPAVTRWRVVRRFTDHAVIEASPETGRQHQIRVHLRDLGHPIVGDKLYGAGEQAFMDYCDGGMTAELLTAFDGLARHALHAHRLVFPHPATGDATTIESPLPGDLRAYIDGLATG